MRLKINYNLQKLLLKFDETLSIKDIIAQIALKLSINDQSSLCLVTEDGFLIDKSLILSDIL